MNILSNKQIHFISYDDLFEMVSWLIDYIYNIVGSANFTCEELGQVSDVIYDHLCDSPFNKYLTLLRLDVSEIVENCAFISDYELFKKDFMDSIMKSNVSSVVINEEIFLCYNNTIKDVFYMLHEFIHIDNLCPGNVVHYEEYINYGDYIDNRPYNFFLNEIPSIMMEGELFDYLVNNYDYDLSFYLDYRIKLNENDIMGLYLPLIGKDGVIYDEYLGTVKYYLDSSENFSLMYMMTYEQDNDDNKVLSYILGTIVSMYAMTLSYDERLKIFNYIRSKITSDDNYFMVFKDIGLDLLDGNNIDRIVSSLYERNRVMKNCLVKKR